MDTTCRSCTGPCNSTSISTFTPNVLSDLNFVFQSHLGHVDDSVSEWLCQQCFTTLKDSAQFIRKSIESFKVLKKLAKNGKDKVPPMENTADIVVVKKEDSNCRTCTELLGDLAFSIFDPDTFADFNLVLQGHIGYIGFHDELPESICQECQETLTVTSQFVTQTIRSYSILKEIQNVGVAEEKLERGLAEVLFECDVCHKTYKKLKILSHHLKTMHMGDTSKICRICDVTLNKESYLSHLRTFHAAPKTYTCTKCLKSFLQASSLNYHVRVAHEDAEFYCDICEIIFTAKHTLLNHLEAHTRKRKKRLHCRKLNPEVAAFEVFTCTICTKSFHEKYHLEKHAIQKHSMNRPWKCQVCGKTFGNKCTLDRHKVMHIGNTIDCNVCALPFHKDTYEFHMQNDHAKLKFFKCPMCPQTFAFRSGRNRHRKNVHEGKKWECDVCQSSYTTKASLKNHMYVHGTESQFQFQCKICRKLYLTKTGWKKHMEVAHSVSRDANLSECAETDSGELVSVIKVEETFLTY